MILSRLRRANTSVRKRESNTLRVKVKKIRSFHHSTEDIQIFIVRLFFRVTRDSITFYFEQPKKITIKTKLNKSSKEKKREDRVLL